jgi:hypothetical protein
VKLPDPLTIAFDLEQMRPGCVFLQVAMGATIPSELFQLLFDSEYWLTGSNGPINGLRVYRTTPDELRRLSKRVTGTDPVFVFDEGSEP